MNLAFKKTGDFSTASAVPLPETKNAMRDANVRTEKAKTSSFFWLLLPAFFLLKYTGTIPQTAELLMVIATLAGFIILFEYSLQANGNRMLACIIAATMTGILWAPYNAGAAAFVMVGVGMCQRLENTRAACTGLSIVCAILLMANAALELPFDFLLPALLFCIPVGLVSILLDKHSRTDDQLLLKHEEIANKARVAERERISRDIHDVLGHTLSVIVLKADLARKLINTDSGACSHELIDIEHSARNILREVRTTVRNCRTSSLNAELNAAKTALQAAGVNMTALIEQCSIPPSLENVIALALREAVTNIIRHAGASKCKITLSSDAKNIRFTIADDGTVQANGAIRKGCGLSGMTERIHALKGSINIHQANGLSIVISLPVKGAA
ncbi:sensor histidine kinase [Undibacterium sp. Tian12W]|uniref:sensor histidine kinase n=1 Tax=Undibacterium sp. Tian12W TaxID=3413054 RepID=UPI003BF26738